VRHRDLGAGLALRAFEEADADELFALIEHSRAYLAPWMPWLDRHTTPTDSLRFIREARVETAAGTSLQLAIVEHERIVGVVSLYAIDRQAGACRCGYWLAPERQGCGIATRAVETLLEHAFGTLGMRRVELRAAPTNARSRRLAERVGFHLARTLQRVEQFPDGLRDQVEYVLRADAWDASRRAG
jgi:ribosomal-protein-serine acetyltransferase